jgi:endonuclease/exonuclease/phosphatase family metal-dependent hydrolase
MAVESIDRRAVLRVMSYNVRYFAHSLRGAGSTRGCLRTIASTIAQLDPPPHLVGLQEVETRSLRSHFSLPRDRPELTQFDVLLEELEGALEAAGRPMRYSGLYFPAHVYQVPGARPIYTTGLGMLISRDLEVVLHNERSPHDITHRGNTMPSLKQSRICAHVRVRPPGGPSIDVFNTHLSLPSWKDTPGFFTRGQPNMGYGPNQAQEVSRLVDFVDDRRESERFVVFGDFNALPGSPAYRQVIDQLRVRDPFPGMTGLSPLELRAEWPTAGFMHLRMRLDHVFLGAGLDAVDFEDSHPFGQVGGKWHGLSDHVPLVGRLGSG